MKEKNTDNYVYLLSHLGMSGRWLPEPAKHSNLWLEFGTWSHCGQTTVRTCDFKMFFDDSRHFGSFTIFLNRTALDSFVNKTTGPDLINDNVTLDQWITKLKNQRLKDKEICLFLLDQKQFSSIGNYLRAEILYKSKINPHRLLKDLSDTEIVCLFEVTMSVIKESYESNGLTIKDYLKPDGSTGKFKCLIYDQSTDPLGNKVIKEKDKQKRTIHWVPEIQK